MELSVIIVSYNVRELLRQCLLTVEKAAEKTDCEMFVVDNSSSDGSPHMVRQEFPDVVLIENTVNKGFSYANNQAIRVASGRFVLLLNPDTVIEDDTFVKCIAFMKDHPDAGALGVRMIDGNGKYLPESKRAFPTAGITFCKIFGLSCLFPGSRLFNRYYLPHIKNNETSLTEVVAGAFMVLRKEALQKTGLLDEDYFMYGEDIDISFRLSRTGYNNYYLADTEIIHFKGMSTDRNKYTDIFHFYRAMIIFIRKRVKEGSYHVSYLLLVPAVFLIEGLALTNRFFCRIINHRTGNCK
jgi:O-antigen biosynthesis protein